MKRKFAIGTCEDNSRGDYLKRFVIRLLDIPSTFDGFVERETLDFASSLLREELFGGKEILFYKRSFSEFTTGKVIVLANPWMNICTTKGQESSPLRIDVHVHSTRKAEAPTNDQIVSLLQSVGLEPYDLETSLENILFSKLEEANKSADFLKEAEKILKESVSSLEEKVTTAFNAAWEDESVLTTINLLNDYFAAAFHKNLGEIEHKSENHRQVSELAIERFEVYLKRFKRGKEKDRQNVRNLLFMGLTGSRDVCYEEKARTLKAFMASKLKTDEE